MNDSAFGLPATRLYGGAIGVVSGGYAAIRSLDGGTAALLMLLVGFVALVHGLVLFTPLVGRLGATSGPLMAGYAVVMLALQAWAATMEPANPAMGMDGMGQQGMLAGPPDWGMVALALLMLFSGIVMTAGPGMSGSDRR